MPNTVKPSRQQARKLANDDAAPAAPETGDNVSAVEKRAMVEAPDHSLDYDYSNFFWGAGDDVFGILGPFDEWYKLARPAGYYLFGLPMRTAPGTRVNVIEELARVWTLDDTCEAVPLV